MKFEFILRDVKEFTNKYRCVCEADRFDFVKSEYEFHRDRLNSVYPHENPFVVLINKLDDDKNFVEVIQ